MMGQDKTTTNKCGCEFIFPDEQIEYIGPHRAIENGNIRFCLLHENAQDLMEALVLCAEELEHLANTLDDVDRGPAREFAEKGYAVIAKIHTSWICPDQLTEGNI